MSTGGGETLVIGLQTLKRESMWGRLFIAGTTHMDFVHTVCMFDVALVCEGCWQ